VYLAKQPCYSTRHDNSLQQEACPNLEDSSQVRKKRLAFTMFWELVSQLQPSQAIKSFYQLLWDDLGRSKGSLKRILALSQAKPAPPTKKAKASLSLPEPPSNLPLSPSPPESFEEVNQMIQEAWKVAFPSLRFPWSGVLFVPN
jgi:hypothetical protein